MATAEDRLAPAAHPLPPPVPRLAVGRDVRRADIVAAAQTMNLAGAGAAGGAALLTRLIDPAIDLRQLTHCIAAEPGIALRVLRVANSAYYGNVGAVSTLERAASVLGLTALRGVAAAACFDRMTARGNALDLVTFRRHSLATACAAQSLATLLETDAAHEAFVAGLMHDIGVIIEWRLRPPGTASVAPGAALPHGSGRHAEFGHIVLETWHLPLALADAVGSHHDVAPTGLSGLLQLADEVAARAGFALSADMASPPYAAAHHPTGGDVGPNVDAHGDADIDAVVAALPAQVERLCGAFGD